MKYAVITVLLLGLAMPAMGVLGLPIAEDGCSEAGLMRVSGGVTMESDFDLYGGRLVYGISDITTVFGGAGMASPDGGDSELYYQLGGTHKLPVQNLPFELSLRGAFGMTSFEQSSGWWKAETDIWTVNVGALGRKPIDKVTVYGLLGLSYQKFDTTVTGPAGSGSGDDTETYLSAAAGVIYPMNEQLSFYGELAHIDELFISAGARYRFSK